MNTRFWALFLSKIMQQSSPEILMTKGQVSMDRTTLAAMQQHSMFLTVEQLHHTIDDHLKRIQIRLTPSTMKVLDILRKHSKMAIGVSYLLIDTIASMTSLSRSSVERANRLLEKVGIIKRIPQIRPKEGGDGANMYAFQPCEIMNEGAQMKGRDNQEKLTPTKDSLPKSEANTGFSFKQKDLKNTYVQEPRLEKDQMAIPPSIPKAFAKAIMTGFSNVKMITDMWKRVIMFKRQQGFTNIKAVLPIALQAWEYTKRAYRCDPKEWTDERFFQCFYGTMREILNAHVVESDPAESDVDFVPQTDEELKVYLDEAIEGIKLTHGAETRFMIRNMLAEKVHQLYDQHITFGQAIGVVKHLGY